VDFGVGEGNMLNLKNAIVMVAGGAGFVGSAVVRELLAHGADVVVFDSYLHGIPENVAELSPHVRVVVGDALDEWKLAQALRSHGVDYIIDCIGDTFVPMAYDMPQRFFDINLRATYNLLQACRISSVKRMLYVSSTEVYGDTGGRKVSEVTPLAPVNTYAVSKLAADRLCHTFHIEHGVPVVIARIFNCYGPRETQPYIVPELIAQLHRGPVLRLGNIDAERDLTYVHDTARALIALLRSEIPDGDAVNVGSDVSFSVRWLAETIADIMKISPVVIERDPERLRRRDIDRFRCDNEKLVRYTGWAPAVSIHDGLEQTVSWFRENGCRWSFESFVHDGKLYR
jgi:nucleoside-diphosphate-sugar epimerase